MADIILIQKCKKGKFSYDVFLFMIQKYKTDKIFHHNYQQEIIFNLNNCLFMKNKFFLMMYFSLKMKIFHFKQNIHFSFLHQQFFIISINQFRDLFEVKIIIFLFSRLIRLAVMDILN